MRDRNYSKLINNLREMMSGMTTQSTPGAAGFSSKSDSKGPVAGYDPLMKFRGKKGRTDFRKVPSNYKKWVKSLGN